MTTQENRMIRKVKKYKDLRDTLASELGKTENGIWQMAVYRPHILLKSAAACRVIDAFNPSKQPA